MSTTTTDLTDAGELDPYSQVDRLPEIVSRSWTCDCGETIERFRGQGDVTCSNCDQEYNAFGQRLRRGWSDNPSSYDEDISDLEGDELAGVRDEEW